MPANLNGLQILARSSAWRHVIELSDRVIEANEATTISVATRLRLEGLFRLKMFDDLSHEAGQILAAERLKRLQHQPAEDLIQNMNKIYAMQLLLAEVKAMTGNGEDAFHELFQLREELDVTITGSHASPFLTPSEWWSWRITSCIINTAIRQRLWRIALSELIGLIKSLRSRHNFNMNMNMDEKISPSSSDLFALSNEPILSFRKLEIAVLCRISRILLQVSDI